MSDSDEDPIPPAPVPPADGVPVPPAQHPVPPADAMPVPPAQHPVAPAPQQPEIQPPAINQGPAIPPINQVAGAAAGAAAAPTRRRPATGSRRRGKKKVARKTSSRRPSYRKPPKPVDSGFSFMSVLMTLLGIAMLAASVYALLPQNLIHIDGYPSDELSSKEPKNLLAAGQAILNTANKASFTEKEVNDYINFRLQGNQDGVLGGMMKVKGIYVDLRPNEAEVFVVRSFPLIGTTTMSSVIKSQFNDVKHQQFWKMGGGSIGRITLKERSLQPVLHAFIRMGRVGKAELEVMNYMADVKIAEDKITLHSSQ